MGTIQTVNFRGDTLYAVERDDGCYVALKPIVEAMGLDWSAQLQRIKRDPILSEGMVMTPTPFGRGGGQDAVCLKLELVNGWLFTIDTKRIKDDDARARVITYQRECYSVLASHFIGKSGSLMPDADERPFPHWSMEELRTKRGTVDMYRMLYGTMAAQWILPQVGFPTPPVEMVENGQQLKMVFVPQVEASA